MNMPEKPPIVRFGAPAEATSWPCARCWPRLILTNKRDAKGYPICTGCANCRATRQALPTFVLDHIVETMQ
jgi:hypothetical protein